VVPDGAAWRVIAIRASDGTDHVHIVDSERAIGYGRALSRFIFIS
jgi:hypothetical protein